jgi:hypothetical protein
MNLIKDQVIRWTEPVFSGSFPKSKFIGERTNTAKILSDSYGFKRGQHSFSLLILKSEGESPLDPDSSCRRLGRNLYKNVVILEEPEDSEKLTLEKLERAKQARERKYFNWLEEAEFEGKNWKISKIPNEFIEDKKEEILARFPFIAYKLNIAI